MPQLDGLDAMKAILIIVVATFVAGCAHRSRSLSSAAEVGFPDEAKVVAIAQRVVAEREEWRKVDCEARRTEQGWTVFVCPKPITIVGPTILMTLNKAGQLTSYEKSYNLE